MGNEHTRGRSRHVIYCIIMVDVPCNACPIFKSSEQTYLECGLVEVRSRGFEGVTYVYSAKPAYTYPLSSVRAGYYVNLIGYSFLSRKAKKTSFIKSKRSTEVNHLGWYDVFFFIYSILPLPSILTPPTPNHGRATSFIGMDLSGRSTRSVLRRISCIVSPGNIL